MSVQERLRKGWLGLLKHTLNRLTRRLARAGIGPFSIVRHMGRRSGKQYETPIIVAPIAGGFMIELTYGPDVDWHKNVLAAGGCTVVRGRHEHVINRIEPVDTASGMAAFPAYQRFVLSLLHRSHFEKLLEAR